MELGAFVRGVEAAVVGKLEHRKAELFLRTSTQETFLLKPLNSKIHWNISTKAHETPTDVEKSAYKRLSALQGNLDVDLIVTGPVKRANPKEPPVIELREFRQSTKSPH